MERTDRRELVALDQAYEFYRELVSSGSTSDIHKLTNSLKTVVKALDAAQNGEMELTLRLWHKIRQALLDSLLTGFSNHVVAITADGRALTEREPLPDDCRLELYPEGLRRDDDVFFADIAELHPMTRTRLDKVWRERGPATKAEDFASANVSAAGGGSEGGGECQDGVCMMKPTTFIVGADILLAEAQSGRQKAYRDYWRLYWQSYCSPKPREKQYLIRQMASLEAVWGNLHY